MTSFADLANLPEPKDFGEEFVENIEAGQNNLELCWEHDMSDRTKKPKDKKWLKYLGWVVLALAAVGVPSLPLLSSAYWGEGINPEQAGPFGDFVGGYIGTIIFALSVVIVFVSYCNQRSTNHQTTFESRFFELLKYDKENVAEIDLKAKTGRRAFVSLIREFRMAWNLVDRACKKLEQDYCRKSKIDLAYMAFYYGVGPNSTRVFKDAVDYPAEMVEEVIREMEIAQTLYQERKKRKAEKKKTKELPASDPVFNKLIAYYELERIHYGPYDGHQSRLAHYYRHLYQMMKYVRTHAPQGKGEEYADIVRAQLSNHEQALLCLNALSGIGSAWLGQRGLLKQYFMIKNIPESFFDKETEFDLENIFPDMPFEFLNSDKTSREPNRDT